jgi:hypothetical protein
VSAGAGKVICILGISAGNLHEFTGRINVIAKRGTFFKQQQQESDQFVKLLLR